VLAAGGVLAAVYLYRPMAAVFERAAETLPLPAPVPVPRAQQLVPLSLAGLSVLLGFAATGLFELLAIGHPVIEGAAP